jgi:hypothetical protein
MHAAPNMLRHSSRQQLHPSSPVPTCCGTFHGSCCGCACCQDGSGWATAGAPHHTQTVAQSRRHTQSARHSHHHSHHRSRRRRGSGRGSEGTCPCCGSAGGGLRCGCVTWTASAPRGAVPHCVTWTCAEIWIWI